MISSENPTHEIMARAYAIRDGCMEATRECTVAARRAQVVGEFTHSMKHLKARLAECKTLDQMTASIESVQARATIRAAIDILPGDATMEQVYLAIPRDSLISLGW